MPQVDLDWIRFENKADFVTQIYNAALEAGLSPDAALLVTAQAAHETGWGRRTMNWNLAGIKAGRWWRNTRNYSTVGTKECVPCKKGETPSPECPPGQKLKTVNDVAWRAYANAVEGVKGILEVLDYGRYRESKRLLLAGNPTFFRQLGKDGWYTASQEVYYRSSMHRLKAIKSMLETLRWQNALLAHDAGCLPKFGADGFWGGEGKAALKAYQAENGLPAHGNRDRTTAIALGLLKREEVADVLEVEATEVTAEITPPRRERMVPRYAEIPPEPQRFEFERVDDSADSEDPPPE